MRGFLLTAAALLIGGCMSHSNAPLLFGQAHSLGVSVGASPAGVPELAVGYKDVDIAYIPTVAQNADGTVVIDATGKAVLLTGQIDGGIDAYSTFGQFQSTSTSTQVGLGKFFATGNAAVGLADGFGCSVSNGMAKQCTGRRGS
jgi:hypothetical protein